MKIPLAQIALPVAGHPVMPVIFFEKTWSISSLVVVSACCFSSSLPAVQPHASGLDILELVGRPVAGFKFCQYSFLALKCIVLVHQGIQDKKLKQLFTNHISSNNVLPYLALTHGFVCIWSPPPHWACFSDASACLLPLTWLSSYNRQRRFHNITLAQCKYYYFSYQITWYRIIMVWNLPPKRLEYDRLQIHNILRYTWRI